MRITVQRFRTAQSGVATIEFALLSTVLLVLFAGTFDLVYMVTAKRDADRASMLIAHTLATACSDSLCINSLMATYLARQANALVRNPTAALETYAIQRNNGAIKVCFGKSMTLTDSTVTASALNLMRDDDLGTAVILTTTYTSILPKALMSYIGSTGATYVAHTVDVMNHFGPAC